MDIVGSGVPLGQVLSTAILFFASKSDVVRTSSRAKLPWLSVDHDLNWFYADRKLVRN